MHHPRLPRSRAPAPLPAVRLHAAARRALRIGGVGHTGRSALPRHPRARVARRRVTAGDGGAAWHCPRGVPRCCPSRGRRGCACGGGRSDRAAAPRIAAAQHQFARLVGPLEDCAGPSLVADRRSRPGARTEAELELHSGDAQRRRGDASSGNPGSCRATRATRRRVGACGAPRDPPINRTRGHSGASAAGCLASY